MPSRPVALFEGILLRSASTISLVIGGMQNLSCDEGGMVVLLMYSYCFFAVLVVVTAVVAKAPYQPYDANLASELRQDPRHRLNREK